MLFNLLGARRGSDARGHDEGHIGRSFAKRIQHDAARLVQNDFEGVGIWRLIVGDEGGQNAAHGIAAGPTLERGHHVCTGHRFAVVKLQARAQLESPRFFIFGNLIGVNHLRLDLTLGIFREQGVVNHVRMIARDVGRGPNGV